MMDPRGRDLEPLAIVGIGCRFPGGADDPAQFWSLLVEQRSGIRDVPTDRWNADRFYHHDPAAAGSMVMRRGGFVENLAGFDAAFWGVSPREALRMDPQQRWLLEVAWEAIEDAGVPPATLRGREVGVFVGISGNDYGGLQLRSTEDVDAYTNSGSTASIASNRISYMLDLEGPSLSLDTACSSSLSLRCGVRQHLGGPLRSGARRRGERAHQPADECRIQQSVDGLSQPASASRSTHVPTDSCGPKGRASFTSRGSPMHSPPANASMR